MQDERIDEQLMILVQQGDDGDDSAFNEIILKWHKRIFVIAKSIVGNTHDAEDITQETFAAVLRWKHTYDAAQDFSPWIKTIAVNGAKSLMHKRKHRQNHIPLEPGGIDVMNPNENDPSEELAKAEFIEDIAKLLQGMSLDETVKGKFIKAFIKLSPIERFLLWEYYAMEKSWEEVTAAVNIKFKMHPGIPMTVGACRVKACRAIGKLREWLIKEQFDN